jgi:hypothetical protein
LVIGKQLSRVKALHEFGLVKRTGHVTGLENVCSSFHSYSFFSFGFSGLQTPQLLPDLEQCLHYLQFLHALHDAEPVQVAALDTIGAHNKPVTMRNRRGAFIRSDSALTI